MHPSPSQRTLCVEYDLQPRLAQSSPPPSLPKYTLIQEIEVNVYLFHCTHAILLCLKDIEHMN